MPEKIIYLRANFNDCKMQWNGTCTDGFYVDWKRRGGRGGVWTNYSGVYTLVKSN